MQATDPRTIDLWCAYLNEMRDSWLLASYGTFLSDAEWQQHSRFHFERDRHRYLVTRALVRLVLSRYAAIDPADWTFVRNAYGRPAIANEGDDARRIEFNVSHTDGLVVLAVTRDRELGVDTENVRSREALVDIAERFFAADETAALRALPRERQQRRFFEYWTLKESYIKARRMGLSLPLDRFSFLFLEDGRMRLSMTDDLDDSPSRWQFWQLHPTTEHLIALCAERPKTGAARLAIRKIVPLVSEEAVEYPLTRISEGL